MPSPGAGRDATERSTGSKSALLAVVSSISLPPRVQLRPCPLCSVERAQSIYAPHPARMLQAVCSSGDEEDALKPAFFFFFSFFKANSHCRTNPSYISMVFTLVAPYLQALCSTPQQSPEEGGTGNPTGTLQHSWEASRARSQPINNSALRNQGVNAAWVLFGCCCSWAPRTNAVWYPGCHICELCLQSARLICSTALFSLGSGVVGHRRLIKLLVHQH